MQPMLRQDGLDTYSGISSHRYGTSTSNQVIIHSCGVGMFLCITWYRGCSISLLLLLCAPEFSKAIFDCEFLSENKSTMESTQKA